MKPKKLIVSHLRKDGYPFLEVLKKYSLELTFSKILPKEMVLIEYEKFFFMLKEEVNVWKCYKIDLPIYSYSPSYQPMRESQ